MKNLHKKEKADFITWDKTKIGEFTRKKEKEKKWGGLRKSQAIICSCRG